MKCNRVIILLIIFFIFFSCKQEVIIDSYTPIYTSEPINKKITEYYQSNSKDSLRLFFEEWHKMIPPVSDGYINQNDTVENIFRLLTDLYKPFKFGLHECANLFENKYEYIAIQDCVDYAVVSLKKFKYLKKIASTDPSNNKKDDYITQRLLNFRPRLNTDGIKYLYLTKEYEKGIEDFLGPFDAFGNVGYKDTVAKKEICKRMNFICPILPIVYRHWGGYDIETFPIIRKIIFDNDFNHAFIEFSSGYGQTICDYPVIKKHGHWKPDMYTHLLSKEE